MGGVESMTNHEQVVVITGAARGVGRGIVQRFRESGAKMVLLDMDIEPLKELAEGSGKNVLVIQCDITRKAEVLAARDQALAHFGRFDVLVNNAGILKPLASLEDVQEADWRVLLDVNLTGAFFCTQAFGVPMLDRGGSIVNIASIAAVVPSPRRGAYSASKAGIMILTQQIALEWGPRKVRANAICPGFIETEMTAAAYAVPGVREGRAALVPWGRTGQPGDIAKVVFFLASPESEYMNGEFLRVDGGFTLTPMMHLINIKNNI